MHASNPSLDSALVETGRTNSHTPQRSILERKIVGPDRQWQRDSPHAANKNAWRTAFESLGFTEAATNGDAGGDDAAPISCSVGCSGKRLE